MLSSMHVYKSPLRVQQSLNEQKNNHSFMAIIQPAAPVKNWRI